MADAWDLRSNIKARAGSQGTLFQGGKSQMGEGRYPRGYTPARLHEVAGAMFSQGTKSSYLRSHDNTDIGGFKRDAQPMRNMVDIVARSTVPVEHLEHRQGPSHFGPPGSTKPYRLEFWSSDQTHEHVNHGYSNDRVAGHYQRNSGAGSDQIHVSPQFTGTPTVIHEIGHHVSALNEFSHSEYKGDVQRGQEEAFADDYAAKNYRNRKGKPEIKGAYGGGQMMLKRSDEFWHHYQQSRHEPMYQPMGRDPWYPPEHVEGQRAFYHKGLENYDPEGKHKGTLEEPYHPDDEETDPHPWARRHR